MVQSLGLLSARVNNVALKLKLVIDTLWNAKEERNLAVGTAFRFAQCARNVGFSMSVLLLIAYVGGVVRCAFFVVCLQRQNHILLTTSSRSVVPSDPIWVQSPLYCTANETDHGIVQCGLRLRFMYDIYSGTKHIT